MLVVAGLDLSAPWIIWCLALLLAFGFVEILYSTIMQSIFKRFPTIVGDISLIKTGLSLVKSNVYWIIPSLVVLSVGIFGASYRATALLIELRPQHSALPFMAAVLLVPSCLYHWRLYPYGGFLSRAVYSPVLHFYRNLEYSKRVRAVLAKSADHFERCNHFGDVSLSGSPNLVLICIESYGSLVYRDERSHGEIQSLIRASESRLADAGYRFASTYSEAPIFGGGSWLSYTSFTYGVRLTDVQLFDGLFSPHSAFGSYESLFHVLKRSGFASFLLCPLGGSDVRSVDWPMIERCFQSDHNIDFQALDYRGPCLKHCGLSDLVAPPDQYSLNRGYELARLRLQPFSLFFCTLNSHIPWISPKAAVSDWRELDDPGVASLPHDAGASAAERYRDAIHYQLDYILRFVNDHADDDLLVVLFGDHQPPLITPERLGKHTPVHVIGRNKNLIDKLLERGFHPSIDLAGVDPSPIKHEGFLSLFLGAMNAVYGRNVNLEVEYRQHGAGLFDELQTDG
jgi:hypothetical protein